MIQIKNWSSFQSYKDRNPPWIRLHKKILDDYEYQSMSANSRALLPMLWLLASEDEDPVSGMLRKSYEQIAFRLRMDINDVIKGVDECEQRGFLTDRLPDAKKQINKQIQGCNQSVTNLLQNSHETVTPETETETEKALCNSEELHVPGNGAKRKRKRMGYTKEFISFWNEYPRRIGKLEAFKTFQNVSKEYPTEDLVASAREYARVCGLNHTEERFIKHPRTFLNEDRWKDYCLEQAL